MSTHSTRKVGDLARMFGTRTAEKTTTTPGRQPAVRKTTRKTTRIEEDDHGTPQCVPKEVKGSFENICDNLDKKDVSYCMLGRQPPVNFVSLMNSEMHEPLPDDVPVVHPACTTSSNENLPKNNSESQNVTLRLPLQPVEPSNEQL